MTRVAFETFDGRTVTFTKDEEAARRRRQERFDRLVTFLAEQDKAWDERVRAAGGREKVRPRVCQGCPACRTTPKARRS